ncbi:yteA family sporulation protein [Salicibibacter halophilus]|uniref:YteA family sporulation protein n=1 Tax=Salicibibacter halophilus TaxID=2502791 RepID=A0A514LG71_9BACI|nr:TraR/DksA C4-type zinc finger protein [Salicibibacter halophilus]QDI90850.1 yteA family sporulation protein [Salicibibacter halophilus]
MKTTHTSLFVKNAWNTRNGGHSEECERRDYMLNEEQINALKKQLKTMKNELEAETEGSNRPEEIGELSQAANHPGDQGTELHEQAKNIALNNQSQQQLDDVQQALQAIEDGTYGHCAVCGESIPYERLEIIPETRLCITHAQAEADATEETRRPVEEDTMKGTLEEKDEKEEVIFDQADTWETVSEHGTSQTPSDDPDTEEEYSDEALDDPPNEKR